MMAAIANHPSDRRSTYSTGADVSRYQRSSVPGRPVDPNAQAGGVVPGSGAGQQNQGPVVRVARGTDVTTVPVGSR